MELQTTARTKRRASMRNALPLVLFIVLSLAWLTVFAHTAQADDLRARHMKHKASAVAMERSMNESVSAHFGGIRLRELIAYLAPRGWRVRFDVAPHKLRRRMVFHTETTRRRAFDEVLTKLNMKGIFYPSKRLLLIYDRERQRSRRGGRQ